MDIVASLVAMRQRAIALRDFNLAAEITAELNRLGFVDKAPEPAETTQAPALEAAVPTKPRRPRAKRA